MEATNDSIYEVQLDLQQLVRESVANAVRHGAASRVRLVSAWTKTNFVSR